MARLSNLLRSLQGGLIAFWCPGCNGAHHVRVEGGPPCWSYNGSPDAPTFTPSIKVEYNGSDAGVDGAPPACCHSFVTDGQIQFCADSTHALAGQTIPLPPFDLEFAGHGY